jgi:hypothetical protein
VNSWCQRNICSGHCSNARAPHTACHNNELGFDATLVRDHGFDGAIFNFKVEHFGVCEYLQVASRYSALAHQCACLQ